ncbi:DUF1998 domain-containing protein [Tessaracoccus sp. MC1865]|uniref:DUF1998 domain-containing protein n=1 Tax=Tessaracoccus sp. MC1865 TaxID=2760310 RepID=UPI001AE19FDD|nr:DUF1998 domain-containing protein [Tessaracoccus sp. MC1865]
MEQISHDLRLQEIVSPFGVGSIVDVLGESLIAPDTSYWQRRTAPVIECQRLVDQLGRGELREPPSHGGKAGKQTASLEYLRFPAWRFCERCERLTRLSSRVKGRWSNSCACGGFLIPMRFVGVCQKGSHIQDIPWFMWAHRGTDDELSETIRNCREYTELRFERLKARGEGLQSLRVVCAGCGRSRGLDELITPSALHRDGITCEGRQPWEPRDLAMGTCDSTLVAVQRGATGNYLAERLSALDIPEEMTSHEEGVLRVRKHPYFSRLVDRMGTSQGVAIAGWIADELGIEPRAVVGVAEQGPEAHGSSPSTASSLLELKDGEWAAFLRKLPNGRDSNVDSFVVDGWTTADFSWPESIGTVIQQVGQVRRVREVRALKGFRRYSPDASFIPADLGRGAGYVPVYPAVELFGEGIFLRFNEEAIAAWESLPKVQARARILLDRRAQLPWACRLDSPEPRFLALHTLAHMLIRRLAFASGYASAALQERVYASSERPDKTAGILITTSAGDAQGTMGGLVRLGEPSHLLQVILAALDDAEVCSNDPVCIESSRQGSAQLNLSACHGCSLVSETSCESGNRLLDRQLLLGGSQTPGLMEAVLPEIRAQAEQRN